MKEILNDPMTCVLFLLLAIPVCGVIAAVATGNSWWLWLLLPLVVFLS